MTTMPLTLQQAARAIGAARLTPDHDQPRYQHCGQPMAATAAQHRCEICNIRLERVDQRPGLIPARYQDMWTIRQPPQSQVLP